MNILKTYEISFSGLSNGEHFFDFEIDNKFFETFEYSEIKEGKLNVHVKLEKQNAVLTFVFSINGTVNVMCDRCTDYFDLAIEGTEKLFVKFGKENYEESDQIVVIPQTDYEINIAQFIYEYITILTPIQRAHPVGKDGKASCNIEMMKKLEELKIKRTSEIDPRWEALKNIN